MRPLSLITAVIAAACLVAPVTLTAQAASAATVTCKDGTTSKAGRGACAHHGGVNKSATTTKATRKASTKASKSVSKAARSHATASTDAATSEPARAATEAKAPRKSAYTSASSGKSESSDPSGAIAKCKDGLYSHSKSRKGACSRHGGVAQWLTPR